jgi:hypothetical protein
LAAKSGTPATGPIRPGLPVSVQAVLAAQQGQTGTTDVTVSTVQDSSTLDNNPDARLSKQPGAEGTAATGTTPPAEGAAQTPAAQPATPPAAPLDPILTKGEAPKPVKAKKEKKPKEPKKKKN